MNKFSGPLARRYGNALFECAIDAANKEDSSLFDQYIDCSRILLSVFDKKMRSFFINPTLSYEEKISLLDTVLDKVFSGGKKIPTDLFGFLKIMLENNRFSELPAVLKNFLLKADEHKGVARVKIISASHLNDAGTVDFSSVLESALNKKIIIEAEVDESLRSGFIIKVGNTNVDASLRSRLLNLKESLS
ncbi:ATP synthase F1 subunit delta [Silvanigrella aquatica]|uniref:ATP synthase subunit delta n=1 Tax=Silvanigrella aquatica TaxID=1915309 RepID=A0A1L4CWX1_9BACT|nr:ATP synthase F1 subunit delta [Silvanigrella aquatica]APJ02450.1 ATP synthase F1 subunit delta [Silvanigrella aquatica]